MRYQWIVRFLANDLVCPDEVMEPFAREVLYQAAVGGKPIVLIMDQSKFSDRHQVLMLAVRYGERALPLAWRVETTEGAPSVSRPRKTCSTPLRPGCPMRRAPCCWATASTALPI
jgi:hypothetical protein